MDSPTNELASDIYHTDAPTNDPESDAFNRWPFAKRIADTVAARLDEASLCVGIYGTWGEGKTSVLRFIERRLAEHPDTAIIHFNPWRFHNDDDLFAGFFYALAGGIGASLKTKRERAAEAIAPYAKLLGPLSVGGLGVSVSADTLSKNIAEAAMADVETLKTRLENLIQETGKKVVVFVDDIDRMEREQIHAIFKLIKACGDFRRVTYLLAFDDSVVAAALGSQYGEGGAKAGYDFLEKIVQVPLRLPAAPRNSLRQYCLAEVDRVLSAFKVSLSEVDAHSFLSSFDRGFSPAVITPRIAKRYGNALTFVVPLLLGEVNIVDLLLIEAMRVFFPTLHDFVKTNPDVVLSSPAEQEDKLKTIETVSSGLSTIKMAHRTGAKRMLLAMFPRLQGVFENTQYGHESTAEWTKAKRIASSDYFARYFSYAVPAGDVSDRDLLRLVRAAETGDATEVVRLLDDVISSATAESIVNKLYLSSDEVSATAASLLSTALVRHAAVFSRQGAFRLSTFTRAAGLVATLLGRVTIGQKRLAAAESIIGEAVPLGFAAECFSWMRATKETASSERLFREDDELRLGRQLARRIAWNANCNLISDEPELIRLMYVWHHFGRTNAPRLFLRKCVRSNPELIKGLLRSAVGTSYPLDGSRPHPGRFDRDAYDLVGLYADPVWICRILKKLFGGRLDGEYLTEDDHRNPDQRVAHEFVQVHRRANRGENIESRSRSKCAGRHCQKYTQLECL
jgi:predicted KAP-like P-loop ATPase